MSALGLDVEFGGVPRSYTLKAIESKTDFSGLLATHPTANQVAETMAAMA